MNWNNEHKEKHMGRGRWIKIPIFIALMVAVKSAIVFYLWNDLVPTLFNGPTLTYLNALELIVLAKFLVGGFGHGGGGFGGKFARFRGRFGHHHDHHHEKHEHRWDGLSAEEREALRAMIRERGER